MLLNEKKEFISNFLNQMKDVFLEEAEKYPEEWDGIELREYIAGAFDFERYTLDKGRKRRYNDERMINNLKY